MKDNNSLRPKEVPTQPSRSVLALRAVGIAVGLLVLYGAVRLILAKSTEELTAEAEIALEKGNFVEAERLVDRALQQSPTDSETLLLAGFIAFQQGQLEKTAEFLQRIEEEDSAAALDALVFGGRVSLLRGRAREAEASFRRVLERDPHHVEAHRELAYVLRLEGRNWEMMLHVKEVLRSHLFDPDVRSSGPMANLVLLLRPVGSIEWVWLEAVEEDIVRNCLTAVPDDPLPAMGIMRIEADMNDTRKPEVVFQDIVAAEPDQIEAQAQLGLLLAKQGRFVEFQQWSAGLPDAAVRHPDVWVARGIAAQNLGQGGAAVRCFGEALRLHPDHLRANYQISQLFVSMGEQTVATSFAAKADQLAELEYLIKEVGSDPERIRELATMMESLNRNWEAAAWYAIAEEMRPAEGWPTEGRTRALAALTPTSPFIPASSSPVSEIELTDYPLPTWESTDIPSPESVGDATRNMVTWRDDAVDAGLVFSYVNGADPGYRGAYMFEFNGGGVAVLDYDGDMWPDVYLTQGGRWPASLDDGSHENQIFRNQGDGRYKRVTNRSHCGGTGFSQGATVGDIDSDGFPDVYVANIGGNHFYRNNGDGTFTDVTMLTGAAGDSWTLSCALADINGDAQPDLYAVNYLGGSDVFERICEFQGRVVQCDPPMFPAEQDRLYLNSGDGGFRDVTEHSGVQLPDGKGMGILVADLNQTRRLDLFVANDTTANFLFVNNTESPGDSPVFEETALLKGVALGENGKAQSGMGIAAGDVTGNGLLDLFVTNFKHEANNMYLHQQDHTFIESARQTGLWDSGFRLMGWGTQFLDGELDGSLDLIVANGDLEDLADVEVPSRMPLMYYANAGGKSFAPVEAAQLGSYFERVRLGRAIATLDWNRDGLVDFCQTNVDAPVALLTNQTSEHGRFLSLSLRGVQTSRDAIGTTVQVTAGEKTLTRQLTAGDGFQASNQRCLSFGLGETARVDELTVDWPSGARQTFQDITADQELLLIEGRNQLFRLAPANR